MNLGAIFLGFLVFIPCAWVFFNVALPAFYWMLDRIDDAFYTGTKDDDEF